MKENQGTIITAVVAVVAILGLVMNFSGGLTGAADTTYVPLQGYPSGNLIDADMSYDALGVQLGEACLSWPTDQQICCDRSCPNDAGFNTCKSACKDVIEGSYGYN